VNAPDPRLRAARRVLADHGFPAAEVHAEGADGEIAAVRCPAAEWDALLGPDGRRAADAVRAVGFRYVAVDLDLPAG
jgi:hypothetical protein